MSTAPALPLEVHGVSKRYAPNHPPILHDLHLSLRSGELLTLLGPSGCGKTTTLRLIAGLERPDAGVIRIAGREVSAVGRHTPPERRGVGMVFQDYALFPHLTVLQNVMFGLPRTRRRERAREILNLVGLTIFENRYPHQLSGGQGQRVALARALAPNPALLLLDEPFSNLDAALRAGTRHEVRSILRANGTSAILVTHDQEEALAFSDRLIVMRDGRIEQEGAPYEVYAKPRSAFTANFLGRSNLITGTASGQTATTALGTLPLNEAAVGPVLLSVRPEQLAFDADGTAVTVREREYKGHDVTYTVRVGEHDLLVHTPSSALVPEGQHARVKVRGVAHVVRR